MSEIPMVTWTTSVQVKNYLRWSPPWQLSSVEHGARGSSWRGEPSMYHKNSLVFINITGTCILHSVSFDLLSFPSGSFGFLQFLLISFVFLWFGAGWILWFSFGVLCFPLVLFGFQGRNKGKENPRKRQTNQGKFKEAISSQNASIMPVTKGTARINI